MERDESQDYRIVCMGTRLSACGVGSTKQPERNPPFGLCPFFAGRRLSVENGGALPLFE